MDPAAHGPEGAGAVGLGVPALKDVMELHVQDFIDGYKQWL